MKKFTDAEVGQALSKVPKQIAALINDPSEPAAVIRTFQKTYSLHIDQVGSIAEMVRNVLLGLLSPVEFKQGMLEVHIPVESVSKILAELNAKIFLPLQKQMQQEAGMKREAPEVKAASTPLPPPARPTAPAAPVTAATPAKVPVPLSPPTSLKSVPPPTGALGSVLRSVAPQAASSVPVRPVPPPVPPMPINRLASSMPKPPAPLPQASQKPLAPPTPGAPATTQRAPQLEEDRRVYVAPLPPKRAMPQPRQGTAPISPNLPGAPAEKEPAAEVQPGRLLNLLAENQPAPTHEAPPVSTSPAPVPAAAPAPQTAAAAASPVPLTKLDPKPYPTDPYREPLE